MPVRTIVALVLATAALLLLAPAADAAPAVTARIGGVEYAATSTQGRFGGAADGQVRGAWQAMVVHDPPGSGKAVPITDGSFQGGAELAGQLDRVWFTDRAVGLDFPGVGVDEQDDALPNRPARHAAPRFGRHSAAAQRPAARSPTRRPGKAVTGNSIGLRRTLSHRDLSGQPADSPAYFNLTSRTPHHDTEVHGRLRLF